MVLEAILIGLLGAIGILDGRIFGQMMFERPLVMGPLVGLVLGDFTTGIIVGATLELVWMGIVGVGSATPPDVTTGGILGTAFAIMTDSGAEVALALAVPIAILAQSLGILVRTINTSFIHRADKYAEEGNARKIVLMHWLAVGLFFLNGFVPNFLGILLGSEVVEGIVNAIPQTITEGLQVAANMFPALGFALLLQMTFTKKLSPFYFLGFGLAVFFGLDITPVAVIGAIIAVVIYQLMPTDKDKEVLL
ncbi:PTS mannose transporter subunit IICD [Terribacillus saccharophilus]|uniref:PTS mannose/fructose/sorbose/N-acetylgalactosamine transporter subunit IIC n=1 Tax=Terribacillus saccharophilus TaxID=361277 RepID=UPI000BA6DE48|nr:PTS sugar transporter subunit IIC [Terribacillus saccharophilus]PAF34170.1 PTS mannose transporter subunit IICD [Terribacillus saccharophilus]